MIKIHRTFWQWNKIFKVFYFIQTFFWQCSNFLVPRIILLFYWYLPDTSRIWKKASSLRWNESSWTWNCIWDQCMINAVLKIWNSVTGAAWWLHLWTCEIVNGLVSWNIKYSLAQYEFSTLVIPFFSRRTQSAHIQRCTGLN